MRYIYDAHRLINMLTYYRDTLVDIRNELDEELSAVNYAHVYEEIERQVKELEAQASYEYEYAELNKPRSFFKRKSVVPSPAICIDGIIEYAKSHGMKCVDVPSHTLLHNECRLFSSKFCINTSHEEFFIFPPDFRTSTRSFLVYHPERHTYDRDEVHGLIGRIEREFEKVLGDGVKPDKYDLTRDEQSLIDRVSKYIREHNDKG